MSELIQTTLPNGLQVNLKEIHTAPIISHWLWYRIGSRDEPSGRTGISHWVEHMQFKGTPQYPSQILDRIISREGGMWNAMTYLDWTAYYEVMPAEKIDIALHLELDRMTHSLFDPNEIESERSVVISERQGDENEPLFKLSEEVNAAAFRVHPYHHEIIGDLADLQSMTREDLINHYHDYYVPNNALISLVGDFNAQEMLEKISRMYEPLPMGKPPHRLMREEPPQRGERRVNVVGPGETTYLQTAYHIPEANHADFLILMALDSLLSGPSGLNMFGGGGVSNKTSRLYRALVETEIAVGLSGTLQATLDPYIYTTTITLRPDTTAEYALSIYDAEIQRIQDTPPTAEEVRRAIKQARALFAYSSESITNQAFWLGYAEMFANYQWFTQYLERLSTVTSDAIQRVAQTYLCSANRTIGLFIPEPNVNKSSVLN